MKRILYIANGSSVHLRQWFELLPDDVHVHVIGLEEPLHAECRNVSFENGVPKVLRGLPKALQYIVLGIMLRRRVRNAWVVHAHNTSGYGLSALLAGRPYIVTTYGTEIYGRHKRSRFYRMMLRKVLARSEAITASSEAMVHELENGLRIDRNKVHVIGFGVLRAFKEVPRTVRRGSLESPIWFVNRRILPNYNTHKIVDAFIRFKNAGGKGRLILLKGDADGAYLDSIRDIARYREDIELIDEFLDTYSLCHYLDQAHFVISVPESDQMSASILEGMSRGCIPIIRDLPAYRRVTPFSVTLKSPNVDEHTLIHAFEKTSRMGQDHFIRMSERARAYALNECSTDRAARQYQALLEIGGALERAMI